MDREAEVIDKIETIRRCSNVPKLSQWPGLTWRAIHMLRTSASTDAGNASYDNRATVAPESTSAEDSPDVAGYRSALTFALHLADAAHFNYDEGILRALHYMITEHDADKKPGRWRRGSACVRRDTSSKVPYAPPPPKFIPALMAELVHFLNTSNGSPALIRAAMAHFNLVAIHAFVDGNGRTARALHTLVLTRAGITEPPFASIDDYVSAKNKEYYEALGAVDGGAWHPERDTRPWIRFCLTAHFYQAKALERRSREYDRLWEALAPEVARRGLPERALYALAQAALGCRLTRTDYDAAAGADNDETERDLQTLIEAGLLLGSADKSGPVYFASERVMAIQARTRDTEVLEIDPFAANDHRH